ncbi:uncharacterized protein LOC132642348 [Lycium barbarum]|uniref:uncharacterized protein LOC132642348 n=1 Tax=Lycium barbarum TaxID=112863 RepID=UPI00293EC870|nr:uncharacterized protein LOC132642348 [Lycium barbarum]
METPAGVYHQSVSYDWTPTFCNHCVKFGYESEKCLRQEMQTQAENEFKVPQKRRRRRRNHKQSQEWKPRSDEGNLAQPNEVEPGIVTSSESGKDVAQPGIVTSTESGKEVAQPGIVISTESGKEVAQPFSSKMVTKSTDQLAATAHHGTDRNQGKEPAMQQNVTTGNPFGVLNDLEASTSTVAGITTQFNPHDHQYLEYKGPESKD